MRTTTSEPSLRADPTRDVYERDADVYRGRELLVPECTLLRRLRDRWADIDMLDIGVGGGRTSFTFGAVCRTYLGVDYAPTLLNAARQRVGESDTCRFALADARDLEALGGEFDVVLFSFNGLDTLDDAGRQRCLQQVHGVLRAGGHFLFSSHSIDGLPLPSPLASLRGRSFPVRAAGALRLARPTLRTAVTNMRLDIEALRRRGYARLRDHHHDFGLPLFYVTAAYQAARLEALGFEVLDIQDRQGRSVPSASPGSDLWLHFLCRKPGA